MLLLLDGHFSRAVSRPLRASGIDIFTLSEWHDGHYLTLADTVILAAAVAEARTLVTYDEHSIPSILRAWGADGRTHGGVVFVNNRTIRQNDFGGQIRALRTLVEERGDEDWRDQVAHLRPS